MMIDMWNWKNQLFYKPSMYCQYVDDQNRIYSIHKCGLEGNITMLSFQYRSSKLAGDGRQLTSLDLETNTEYFGDNLAEKAAAILPALSMLVVFAVGAIWSKSKPLHDS